MSGDDDKIAIIGVGCRFPGADDINEFWKVLLNGENHVKDIPKERWNVDAIFDPDPDAPGKTYVRKAGLIQGHDMWDNNFFGISDSEAEQIDPQQRLVLDCVHMALENAGVTKTELNGSTTGVYIGAMNDDFRGAMVDDSSKLSNYTVTGNALSIISARVSYVYNLLGPALTIDTACSSALVAINTGIHGIKQGDCKMALCGGVNSILYPEMFVALSKARMMSPSGQCQSFSAKADGYARGEGCGIVLLKRLADAQKDGNFIWATITTGCNQDGHTTSPITAPSSIQQKTLLEKVFGENNVDPCSVQYIEAHGTGTPVGDPIEVDSLGSFFMQHDANKTNSRQIYIGSVKSNIGHTESAAGVAGVIKVLLMMKNGTIVPSLHSDELNPKIQFEKYGFVVARNITNWKENDSGRRIACVNSFGFGGTNSHAIIEQVQDRSETATEAISEAGPFILALSAADKWSLEHVVRDYIPFLKTYKGSIQNLSYTLLCKRDHYGFRYAVVSNSISGLQKQLEEELPRLSNTTQITSSRRIIFVFCGVGTTWSGMCKTLITSSSVFRQVIEEIDKYLQAKTNWSLQEKLKTFDENSDPFTSHICIFGCQIGLSKLWRHWGIHPDVIIGQSVGEVAAAYVAGYLSLKDAVTVIYERSRALSKASGGRMSVVLNLETKFVEDLVQNINEVSIAVYNSSRSCTLTGDASSLKKIEDTILGENGAVLHPLNVKCAYHSHYVQAASEELEKALENIIVKKPVIPVYSTVSGDYAGTTFATAHYWKQNIREPVLFSKAVEKSASDSGINIFLEIGPKPVLKTHAGDILQNQKFSILPSLKPSKEFLTLLTSMVAMYQHGVNPVWSNLFDTRMVTSIVHTQCYRFKRKPIFLESEERQKKSQGATTDNKDHLFLKPQSHNLYQYKASLDPAKTKFVYEHKVQDVVIVPGALYCEIAFAVGVESLKCSFSEVQANLEISNAVFIQNSKPCYLYCMVETVDTDKVQFEVTSDQYGNMKVASGFISRIDHPLSLTFHFNRFKECSTKISSKEFYEMLSKMGFSYGETLRNFDSIQFNSKEVIAKINVSHAIKSEIRRTFIHPAVLDTVLQSFAPLMPLYTEDKDIRVFPSGIKNVVLHRAIQEKMVCYTRLVDSQPNSVTTNSVLVSNKDEVIAEFQGIRYSVIDEKPTTESFEYEVKWQKVEKQLPPTLNQIKTLCFSVDERVKRNMESLLEGHEVRFFNMCDSERKIHEVLSSSEEFSCILYYPGYRFTTDESSPLNLYHGVKLSCFGCLEIVQAMNLKETPIIVITEDTHSISNCSNEIINLIGSELWGMVRSIASEPSKTRIYLLDINTKIPIRSAIFQSIVSGVFNGDFTHEQEMLVKNNELYTNALRRPDKPISSISFRTNFVDANCRVCIKSSTSRCVTRPFLTMQKDTLNCQEYNDSLLLEVKSVYLHPSLFYPLTSTERDGIKTFISRNNTDGHQILTLEIIGIREQAESDSGLCCSSRTAKVFPQGEKKGRVAVLYPSKAMSFITVPTSCVIALEKIPGYHIGTLQAAFIAWHFSEQIGRNNSICILYDQTIPRIYIHVLQTILQIRNRCSVALQLIENIQSNEMKEEVCVIFGDINIISPELFEDRRKKLQMIMSLSIFMPVGYLAELRDHNQHVTVMSYDLEKMFDSVNVKMRFPVVKTWILKNWKNPLMQTLNKKLEKTDTNVLDIPSQNATNSSEMPSQVRVERDELFRNNACYVVIGGLTGLGWEILKLLCIQGAGYVVSISRRSPSHAVAQQIENMQSICGTKVLTLRADVCDFAELQEVFKNITKIIPNIPVKGIFQGAGILDDALYMDMTREKFEKVLRPKVLGTWNLHLISRQLVLDYFVMHSSVASVFGNIGQTNYAAGNSFLDGLAHFRRATGLPGQSINWGALSVGMAKDKKVKTYLDEMGFLPLDVEYIKSCFISSLQRNACQITYSNFDWSRISENLAFGMFSPLKNRVSDFIEKQGSKTNFSSDDLDYELFNKLTQDEKFDEIKTIVKNIASEVLSIDKQDILDNKSLVELGLDSQQSIEYSRLLEQITGCKVPFAFMRSNEFIIIALVQYIIENISSTNADHSKTLNQIEKVKGSMTYMEKVVYENLAYYSGCSMFIQFEFEVSKSFSSPALWRKILQWILAIHPELRTIYRTFKGVRFNVMKTILPKEGTVIDFRTTSGTLDEETETEFDPSKDCPFRATLFHWNKKSFIRFMVNRIATDLKGCLLIFKLIYDALVSFCTQNKIPDVCPRQAIDYALMYEESTKSRNLDLQDFWKRYLNCPVEFVSFSKLREKRQRGHKRGIITQCLSGSVYCKLQHYLQEKHITCFQLFTCLYQCILYRTFRCSSLAVKAKICIQDYPQEFQGRIWQSWNYIPIIPELPSEDTIGAFIVANSANIQRCVGKALYPFELIMKDNNIDPNAFCHEIIAEDLSPFYTFTDDNKFWMNFCDVQMDESNTESSLLILQRDPKQEITLHLRFDSNVIDTREAEQLLDDLVHLLSICMEDPMTKLGEIDLETFRLNTSSIDYKEAGTESGTDCIEETKL